MNFQNLKSKVDKMTEKLIGKREEFRIRLNRIYGVEGHEEQVNTILKKNRRLAILDNLCRIHGDGGLSEHFKRLFLHKR
mgnify:CR=1 FL=1